MHAFTPGCALALCGAAGLFLFHHMVPAYRVAHAYSGALRAVASARPAREFSALAWKFFGVARHGMKSAAAEVARLARWQSGLLLSDDGKPYGNFCNVKAHSCIGVAHQQTD